MQTLTERALGLLFTTLFVLSVYWLVTGSLSPSRYPDPVSGCRTYACWQIDSGNGP